MKKTNYQSIIYVLFFITVTFLSATVYNLKQRITKLENQFIIQNPPLSFDAGTPYISKGSNNFSKLPGDFYSLQSDYENSKMQTQQNFSNINSRIDNLKDDTVHNTKTISDLNTRQLIICNDLNLDDC